MGTPAATTRGMTEHDMRNLGAWIVDALRSWQDPEALERLRRTIETYCLRFPVPGIDTSDGFPLPRIAAGATAATVRRRAAR